MFGNTNYSNLTNTLSHLNKGGAANLNNQQQQTSTTSGSASLNFSNTISNNFSGFMSSFGGFQQQLGQRYSMSDGQTTQLLQTFTNMLEDLVGDVVNNSSRHSGGSQTTHKSAWGGGASQNTNSWSGQTGSHGATESAGSKSSVWSGQTGSHSATESAGSKSSVWSGQTGSSDATASVDSKSAGSTSSAGTNVWSGQSESSSQKDSESSVDRAGKKGARTDWQTTRNERQSARADKSVQSNTTQTQSGWQNTAGATAGQTTGRADAANSVTPANAVDAVDNTSAASGGEAAQVHKSGGCPFMATESEQSSSGGAQADNSANSSASNQNSKPAAVAGAAGPSGQQGSPASGGSSSAETAPAKPAGHPPVKTAGETDSQPAKPAENPSTPSGTPSKAGGADNSQPAKPAGNPSAASGSPSTAGTDSSEAAKGPGNIDKADDRGVDFSKLSKNERDDMGLDARERGVIHLWGRQMMSAGEQNGGIYTNVLGADGTGANWPNKEEVALVKELRAQENEKFGTDTGWMLDEAYFAIMKDKTGVDMSARYADRPVNESKGPVLISNDIDAVADRTGISGFEQGVMRLMGHDALMDGEFDGSVLEYTVGNANSLDSNKHSGGNAIDDVANTLLAQDKADDGEVNGSSIMNETIKTLDRLYA